MFYLPQGFSLFDKQAELAEDQIWEYYPIGWKNQKIVILIIILSLEKKFLKFSKIFENFRKFVNFLKFWNFEKKKKFR